MVIKKSSFFYLLAVVLITIIAAIVMNPVLGGNTSVDVKKCGMICFIHFCVLFFIQYFLNSKRFTLYSFYILAFFLFQCGQYVIYAFGAEYNYIYLEKYSTEMVIRSIYYSTLCNASVFAAAPASLNHKEGRFQRKLNQLDDTYVYSISKMMFWVLSAIELPYCIIRFLIVVQSGYQGVRAFESIMPSVLSFIDMFYIPTIILCMIYGNGKKTLYSVTLIIWAIMNSLNGDRSSGIAAIIVFGLMYLNGILKRSKNEVESNKKSISPRRIIVFVLIGLAATWLITYAYNFRNHITGASSSSFIGMITDAVGELGFSFFPLLATMLVCPSRTGFLYGKSIVFSFLSSVIPLSLDFTGIFRSMYNISKEGVYWLTEYYNFSFGLGYSLNAESYANFGMLGFLWILVLSVLVAKLLSQPDYHDNSLKFSQYRSLAMLFILFTMPRRSCYYLSNFYIYYVLLMGFIFLSFSKRKSVS